jgi:phosphonate transport system substrate-binding protein
MTNSPIAWRQQENALITCRLITLIVTILIFASPGFSETSNPPQPVQIAILPCDNIEITFEKFYPLLKYLTQQTNLDVHLVVPADFNAFEASLKKGQIDFILQDPHVYLVLANFYNNNEILRTLSADGSTTHSAVVVVRRDSQLKDLKDLRGKTVMFGPKASIAKWVAAKLLFAANGINLDKDLRAYVNGGCCEDIAFSVYLKSVDAGVVCAHFLAEHHGKQKELGVEADQLVAIGQTKPCPNRVLAPYKNVSPTVISKINAALLALDIKNPDHAQILYRGELGGFQRAQPKDYDELRKLPIDLQK